MERYFGTSHHSHTQSNLILEDEEQIFRFATMPPEAWRQSLWAGQWTCDTAHVVGLEQLRDLPSGTVITEEHDLLNMFKTTANENQFIRIVVDHLSVDAEYFRPSCLCGAEQSVSVLYFPLTRELAEKPTTGVNVIRKSCGTMSGIFAKRENDRTDPPRSIAAGDEPLNYYEFSRQYVFSNNYDYTTRSAYGVLREYQFQEWLVGQISS